MKYSELNDKDRWAAIRAGVKAGYTKLDDIEDAYNKYADGGNILGNLANGSKVDTTECAAWSNGLLRNNGYIIYGDAWNLKNVDPVFSGYDTLERPSQYNLEAVQKYNHDASDRIYKEFDSKTLDPKKHYVVNMYYNGSPKQEVAYNEGRNTGTHTGTLTYDEKNKRWIVTHNVHGTLHQEPFIQLQSGKNKYGVTAIYAPREDTFINRAKDFFGFADGGNIAHKFDGLTGGSFMGISPAQQFTNSVWNSDTSVLDRINSDDTKISNEALRYAVERENSENKKNYDNSRKLWLEYMQHKDRFSPELAQLLDQYSNRQRNDSGYYQQIVDAYNKQLKQQEAVNYNNYSSGIGKMAARFSNNPEFIEKAERVGNYMPMAGGAVSMIPTPITMAGGQIASTATGALNFIGNMVSAGSSFGNDEYGDMKEHLKEAGSDLMYMTPGLTQIATIKDSPDLAKGIYENSPEILSDMTGHYFNNMAKNRDERQMRRGVTPDGYSLADTAMLKRDDKIDKFRKEYPMWFDEQGNVLPGAITHVERLLPELQKTNPEAYDEISRQINPKYIHQYDIKETGYNPAQNMLKAEERKNAFNASQMQNSQPQITNIQTQNNSSVSTQPPIQVKPSNTGAGVRSANTSATATTPITTNTTTTANVQQPTKMQGFMSKLGQAAPYLADFAGWTFGNSRFFNYGGNLYEVNNK